MRTTFLYIIIWGVFAFKCHSQSLGDFYYVKISNNDFLQKIKVKNFVEQKDTLYTLLYDTKDMVPFYFSISKPGQLVNNPANYESKKTISLEAIRDSLKLYQNDFERRYRDNLYILVEEKKGGWILYKSTLYNLYEKPSSDVILGQGPMNKASSIIAFELLKNIPRKLDSRIVDFEFSQMILAAVNFSKYDDNKIDTLYLSTKNQEIVKMIKKALDGVDWSRVPDLNRENTIIVPFIFAKRRGNEPLLLKQMDDMVIWWYKFKNYNMLQPLILDFQ